MDKSCYNCVYENESFEVFPCNECKTQADFPKWRSAGEETDDVVVLGLISWSPAFPPDNYGELTSDILEGHEGKVFAYDVISKERDLNGVLFVDKKITMEDAIAIFDDILENEEKFCEDCANFDRYNEDDENEGYGGCDDSGYTVYGAGRACENFKV